MQSSIDKSDLILFESALKDSLASFMDFSAYSLYFPREIPQVMLHEDRIIPLVEKDRTLLPLIHQEQFLGIFMARGTCQEKMNGLSGILPAIVSLCLDKVTLHKLSVTDHLTGLYNQNKFLQITENAIEDILAGLSLEGAEPLDGGLNRYSASFCVMLLNLDRFKRINEIFGYSFADKVLRELAVMIEEELPEQAMPARLENDTLAVFWPQSAPVKCRELSENLSKKISSHVFEYGVSGEKLSLSACTGWSLFPQDIKGPEFKKTAFELAHLICHKAREALKVAKENGPGTSYAFGQILSQGGIVLEILPLNRLIINLGKNVDASEGQKFMVWSQKFNGLSRVLQKPTHSSIGHYPPIHKGEIAIQDVQERMSIAEVLFLNDPAWKIEPGDKLSMLAERDSFLEKQAPAGQVVHSKDLFTGLYSYRDFMSLWTKARIKDKLFCMAMLKLEDVGRHQKSEGIEGENLILEITRKVDKIFASKPLGGRYSLNCLIFYHPEQGCGELKDIWISLIEDLWTDHHLSACAGLTEFPCLNFSKTDSLENCRKALEHAALTSPPKLACFDSMTLTVSADSLFTQGDTFAALEEYKQALAADEKNTLARNSLAICYARLGRMELARQHFQEITSMDNENLLAWYNLGCVCIKQGDDHEAEKLFSKCLDIEPEHAYSLFRLGQLAENDQEYAKAEKFYLMAGQTSSGASLAPRHLARLSWKQGDKEKSREFLHQALLNNSRDAFSLNLMAKIYLENGDDPEIAESLARQGVALRPDVREFWLDLAEIFEAGGKEEQAAQARSRVY